jgi:hypothetical protein
VLVLVLVLVSDTPWARRGIAKRVKASDTFS